MIHLHYSDYLYTVLLFACQPPPVLLSNQLIHPEKIAYRTLSKHVQFERQLHNHTTDLASVPDYTARNQVYICPFLYENNQTRSVPYQQGSAFHGPDTETGSTQRAHPQIRLLYENSISSTNEAIQIQIGGCLDLRRLQSTEVDLARWDVSDLM